MRVAPQSRVRHPMEAKQLVYVQSSREGIYSSANFRIDWLKWPPRVKKEFALYSACRCSLGVFLECPHFSTICYSLSAPTDALYVIVCRRVTHCRVTLGLNTLPRNSCRVTLGVERPLAAQKECSGASRATRWELLGRRLLGAATDALFK
ncbi:hypothetical protein BHM03_00017190 [Ensete ventricosum]|nr:hypothetical protein BHM03_00017190 [Ensete ventricosum]